VSPASSQIERLPNGTPLPRLVGQPSLMPKHGGGDLDQFNARMEELFKELASERELLRTDLPYEAYTDGACLGNPDGPGGWGAVVAQGPLDVELWGHLSSTSNNRAEVLAVLAALEWVPRGATLLVNSDSQYTLQVLTGDFKAKANVDLWATVRSTISLKGLLLKTRWVKGHAGIDGNERADRLAVLGSVRGDRARLNTIRQPGMPSRPAAKASNKPEPKELEGLDPRGPWEQQFVSSLRRQLQQGKTLSEKQQVIVDRIRGRSDISV
jgi:ribonuclease HI